MRQLNAIRAVGAALIGVAMTCTVSVAHADIKDYEFQLIDQTVEAGPDKIITVRLVNKTTGKPVPDAVIFAIRLDMAPDGMAEMSEPIDQLSSTEPGVYRFKAAVVMPGGWRLLLGAKVQGEAGTVQSELEFRATP